MELLIISRIYLKLINFSLFCKGKTQELIEEIA